MTDNKQNQPVIKLELTANEVEYVLDSLSYRPWREVNDLIIKISTQYRQAISQLMNQTNKTSLSTKKDGE